MARLRLAQAVFLSLLALMLILFGAAFAGRATLPSSLDSAELARTLRAAWPAVVLAAFLAVPLGLAAASAMAAAGAIFRATGCALAVLLLIAPMPGYGPHLLHPGALPQDLLAAASAIARGAAAAVLILTPSLRTLPRGLVRAAIWAGAHPLRAAADALLWPLAMPLLAAALAAALLALVQGPAGTFLAPQLDLARAWLAPAAVLLLIATLAGFGAALRRPRA